MLYYARNTYNSAAPCERAENCYPWNDGDCAVLGNEDLTPIVPEWIAGVWNVIENEEYWDRLYNMVWDVEEVKDIVARFEKESGNYTLTARLDLLCDLLHYVDSEHRYFRATRINGSVQREWNYLIHTTDFTRDDIGFCEACYYETGEEWEVSESPLDWEEAELVYTAFGYDDLEKRRLIAKEMDCDSDEIVLCDGDEELAKVGVTVRELIAMLSKEDPNAFVAVACEGYTSANNPADEYALRILHTKSGKGIILSDCCLPDYPIKEDE